MSVSKDPKYDTLFNEAISLFAAGNDNKYIELQFADKGVDDKLIDLIIKDINILRKTKKRNSGMKLLIYGGSAIAIALIFSFISFNASSPIHYVLWGLGLGGVMTAAKGIVDMVMP